MIRIPQAHRYPVAGAANDSDHLQSPRLRSGRIPARDLDPAAFLAQYPSAISKSATPAAIAITLPDRGADEQPVFPVWVEVAQLGADGHV